MSYDVYGVCPCGWYKEAPFGDLFHIHRWVCPDCGRPKSEWRRVTGRVVNEGSWWSPRRRVVSNQDSGRDT